MSMTWDPGTTPPQERIGAFGWVRAILRAVPLAIVVFGCLALLLVVRLIERPLCGVRRPVTPYITQFVCVSAFFILGIPGWPRGRARAMVLSGRDLHGSASCSVSQADALCGLFR